MGLGGGGGGGVCVLGPGYLLGGGGLLFLSLAQCQTAVEGGGQELQWSRFRGSLEIGGDIFLRTIIGMGGIGGARLGNSRVHRGPGSWLLVQQGILCLAPGIKG